MRMLATLLTLAVTQTLAYDVSNAEYTPGATNPVVKQDNIKRNICVPGWTKNVRPPVAYTNKLKKQLMHNYGIGNERPQDYELDHLIPLELGGAPRDQKNLWPQPWVGQWNAHMKDELENKLHKLVCEGTLPLHDAQEAIRSDWKGAYDKYEASPK